MKVTNPDAQRADAVLDGGDDDDGACPGWHDVGTIGSREPTAQRPICDLTILWAGLTVPGPYTPFHPSREPGTTGSREQRPVTETECECDL